MAPTRTGSQSTPTSIKPSVHRVADREQSKRTARGGIAPLRLRTVDPPGGYGDGPVLIRVHRESAGHRWPTPEWHREVNDWRLAMDPEHDYILVQENSRTAFQEIARMRKELDVPPEAVCVVRPGSPRSGQPRH